MRPPMSVRSLAMCLVSIWATATLVADDDFVRELQTQAIQNGKSPFGHWGPQADNYVAWKTHSNRLIPVYTFGTSGGGKGIDLTSYSGSNSAYRSADALRRIYGKVPTNTVNPDADYLDQTDLASLQRAG